MCVRSDGGAASGEADCDYGNLSNKLHADWRRPKERREGTVGDAAAADLVAHVRERGPRGGRMGPAALDEGGQPDRTGGGERRARAGLDDEAREIKR